MHANTYPPTIAAPTAAAAAGLGAVEELRRRGPALERRRRAERELVDLGV